MERGTASVSINLDDVFRYLSCSERGQTLGDQGICRSAFTPNTNFCQIGKKHSNDSLIRCVYDFGHQLRSQILCRFQPSAANTVGSHLYGHACSWDLIYTADAFQYPEEGKIERNRLGDL